MKIRIEHDYYPQTIRVDTHHGGSDEEAYVDVILSEEKGQPTRYVHLTPSQANELAAGLMAAAKVAEVVNDATGKVSNEQIS
jgi:hypothetical protein